MKNLGNEIIFFDGGMGTLLQAQGLDTLPEIWNITNAAAIFDVHKAYASAGCDIVKTNTLGANRLKLAGSGYTPAQVIEAGVGLAKKAASVGAKPVKVALSLGPTGRLLAPVGDLPFEEAIAVFAEAVCAGAAAGADFILFETMNDTYEIKAAMLAAKENCDLPIMVTFSPDEAGRLLTGADIITAATLAESFGAAAVGLNCGFGPAQMAAHLEKLCAVVEIPVIFNPNGGMPRIENGKTVFDLSPEEFTAQMKEILPFGASILGGCCGTTPSHIGAMVSALSGIKPAGVKKLPRTRVTSFARTVILGENPAIIGERINPTGKPKLKKALRENNMGFIENEALTQVSQGADLLDVNVGLPGIDEAKMLAAVVSGVQAITAAPLVIDTSDTAAAEAAMRIYNGKPLLNSVNGKRESLEAILPLAKKYGAALIALALDDDGIPETAPGRVAIAEKIIAAAAAHGIPKSDIIVDALTMTLSTNPENARITLEAVDVLRKKGICTVLGVSNISFGLPARDKLNAAFLSRALANGLSAAIINPANENATDAIAIHKTLSGGDENCAGYVERFSDIAEAPAGGEAQKSRTLYDAIISGLENEAKTLTEKMLSAAAPEATPESAPMKIISTQLIPALDTAGQTFAAGKTFLPQLLKSASAATAAFEVIRAYMSGKGTAAQKRGKIILATVYGDIHDIGKNIVKTLLENYNFEVFDLGKNVPPEEIVRVTLAENAPLVGLSALMTTTVAAMEETIKQLRAAAPEVKIMVGGAVLTGSYAKKIGADFYSPDAIGAVRYAETIANAAASASPVAQTSGTKPTPSCHAPSG